MLLYMYHRTARNTREERGYLACAGVRLCYGHHVTCTTSASPFGSVFLLDEPSPLLAHCFEKCFQST